MIQKLYWSSFYRANSTDHSTRNTIDIVATNWRLGSVPALLNYFQVVYFIFQNAKTGKILYNTAGENLHIHYRYDLPLRLGWEYTRAGQATSASGLFATRQDALNSVVSDCSDLIGLDLLATPNPITALDLSFLRSSEFDLQVFGKSEKTYQEDKNPGISKPIDAFNVQFNFSDFLSNLSKNFKLDLSGVGVLALLLIMMAGKK